MSVIVTRMEMPESCFECPDYAGENSHCLNGCFIPYGAADDNFYRSKDCHIKSIDGLIDEIEKMKITSGVKNQGTWNECLHYVVETIKEYCEVAE